MSWLIPRRRPCREMLDDLDLAPEEMARSLRDLELVNGKWGGSRALDRYLLPLIRAARQDHFVILDVGARRGRLLASPARRRRRLGRVHVDVPPLLPGAEPGAAARIRARRAP